jgi:hypothetical protein
MTSKSFHSILKEAKRSRFDDYHKGLTVVNENHFAHNNEELNFAKEFTRLTHKKGRQESIGTRGSLAANPITQSETSFLKPVTNS